VAISCLLEEKNSGIKLVGRQLLVDWEVPLANGTKHNTAFEKFFFKFFSTKINT